MADQIYITRDGDVLDKICWNFYGTSRTALEATYARNYGLSEGPLMFPAGIAIILPDPKSIFPTQTSRQKIAVWQ